MTIELIYFAGCPNIEKARESIKSACKKAGISEKWKEIDQNASDAPDYVDGYGSPTILVNGKDVAGGKADCCATGNCRIYPDMTGVPSAELILTALER